MIQLRIMLKAIWIQISFVRNTWCKDSKRTLQRMGYIMIRRPTAEERYVSVERSDHVGESITHRWELTLPQTFLFGGPVLYLEQNCPG